MLDAIMRFIRWLFGMSDKPTKTVSTTTYSDSTYTQEADYYPYQLRDDFLSPAEFTFYRILSNVVREKANISVKVNLSDLFWVQTSDNSEFRTYTNKIDRKHLDYLLCHPQTMKPLLGIELDDSSHQRADRAERDAFVDEVFASAGLPLIHIPVRRGYQFDELSALLMPYLKESPTSSEKSNIQTELTQDNQCPKCGGEMILRTAKKGKNAGQQFWGCTNYPNCRTVIEFER